MAIEEFSELIVALQHHRRGRCGKATVAEEIADCMIMLEQLKLIYGVASVDLQLSVKEDRLRKRVKDE